MIHMIGAVYVIIIIEGKQIDSFINYLKTAAQAMNLKFQLSDDASAIFDNELL